MLILYSVSALSLQDYVFSVEKPELIIFPQTEASKKKQKTRLSVLTDKFSKANQFEVYQYIQIVLNEMITVYEEESERAREQAVVVKDKKKRQKLYRWSNDVLTYADKLIDVYNSMDDYSHFQVYTDNNYASYLLVDNYPVVITSPVINQQAALEQNIINSICERMHCDMEYLNNAAEKISKKILVQAGWKVTEKNYVFYTKTGLHYVFKDIKHKQLKQKMCLKISADLILIAQTLKEIIKKGVFVDWKYIKLQQKKDNHLYELTLNPFGDKVLIPLKSIHLLDDLPKKAVPWFKEMVNKTRKEFYLHNADEYLKIIYTK